MLQHEKPDNYVVGTGETHSVREFCELAFGCVGLDYNQYVVQKLVVLSPGRSGLAGIRPEKGRQCSWLGADHGLQAAGAYDG